LFALQVDTTRKIRHFLLHSQNFTPFFRFQPRVLRKGIDFRVKKQTTNAKRFLRLASEKHEND